MKLLRIIVLVVMVSTAFILLSACGSEEEHLIGVLDMDYLLEESGRARHYSDRLAELSSELQDDFSDEYEQDEAYQQYLSQKEALEKDFDQEIEDVLQVIKEKKNLDIIVSQESIFHGGNDITEETINILDEKHLEDGGGDE